MSQIKAKQRLIVEDFPTQKEWIAKLFSPLNQFVTEVVAAINSGIEFEKNIQGMEREFDFSYQALSFPVGFKWRLASRPKCLVIAQMTEDNQPIIGLIAWEFTAEGLVSVTEAVKITASGVAGLQLGSRYKILVRVTP